MISYEQIRLNTTLQYIAVVILFSFVTLFFYIKLRYPFWNGQPVYHIYDYWRIFYREPRVIRTEYPSITKYCNFADCTTIAYQDATPQQIEECMDLLQTQYLRTDDAVFVFNGQTMDSYMTGHIHSSYLTVYLEPFYPSPSKKIIKPLALMTSRSIRISGDIPTYYWDLICSNRELPLKRTYELIQTHNYRTRILNPDIKIGFFKRIGRETEDYAVVPAVRFTIVSYRMNSFTSPSAKPPPLPKYHLVVDVNRTNIGDVLEYVENKKESYEFWAIADTGNLEGLLLGGLLYGYIILVRGQIHGLYVFRDSRISIDGDGEDGGGGPVLSLVASINYTGSRQVFYDGFLHSGFLLVKQYPIYKILSVESLGDNQIIENLLPLDGFITETLGAYYFYNYFYRTVAGSQCFIVL